MAESMKRCDYGVTVPCGARAVTTRQRPSVRPDQDRWWDVCQRHADVLDRLTARIKQDKPILDRLADDGPRPNGCGQQAGGCECWECWAWRTAKEANR